MKGTCEIQLTNTDGSIAQQTRDNNMITNAISNLLNPPPLFFAEGGDYATYMRSVVGSMEKLLGGVMLWSEPIEENPDIILPPNIEAQVGYAGNDAYTGANAFRGSFNAIESGRTHTGYKFVWDFPTSAANGTIKCVTATSGMGGRCGWWGDDTTAINRYVGCYVLNSNNGVTQGRKFIGCPVASTAPGRYTFINCAGSYKAVDISEAEIPTYEIKASSKPMFTYSVGRDFQEVTTTRIETPMECWNSASNTPCDVNIHEDYIGMVYTRNNRAFNYTKISFTEKALISQVQITTPFSCVVSDGTCLEYDGFLYVYSQDGGSKICKINLSDTTDITTITTPKPFSSTPTIRCINGLLAIMPIAYGSTAFGWYLIGDNFYEFKPDLGAEASQSLNIGYSPAIKAPFFIAPKHTSRYSEYFYYGHINIYNAYLATINNLTTPIQKTASQSMKVVYTFTDVEESVVV